jgi:hypothetical protein
MKVKKKTKLVKNSHIVLFLILFLSILVGGLFAAAKLQKEKSLLVNSGSASVITVVPTPATVKNIVGSYVNNDYKFSFEIPKNWQAEQSSYAWGGYLQILSPDFEPEGTGSNKGVRVQVTYTKELPVDSENKKINSTEELIRFIKTDPFMKQSASNGKVVIVDGRSAYQYDWGYEANGTFTDVIYQGMEYSINIYYPFSGKEYSDVYQQILKSVKLIK